VRLVAAARRGIRLRWPSATSGRRCPVSQIGAIRYAGRKDVRSQNYFGRGRPTGGHQAQSPCALAGCRGGLLRRVHGPARCEHRDPDLPADGTRVHGAAGGRPVGIAGVSADPGGAAGPGRAHRRRHGPQADLRLRIRALHHRLGGVRARAVPRRTGGLPDFPGRRRRHAAGQQRCAGYEKRPGCVAVIAGHYLLPRTRQLSRTDSFDRAGAFLLAATTTSLLVALSAAGGLPMPGWAAIGLAGGAGLFARLFAGRQRRARFPLIPPALMRSLRLALALSGAFFGYLALFGPLVLVPQVMAGHGRELRTGLLLSALPAGFGVAALSAEAVLPTWLTNRQRGFAGAATCAFALVMLMFMPETASGLMPFLALAGLGLGLFVPANNAVIMRSSSAGSAAVLGGLVNMARGIGTTFGIALVTIALHLARVQPDGRPDPAAAFLVLAMTAAAGAVIALLVRPRAAGPGPAPAGGPPPAELGHSGAFG